MEPCLRFGLIVSFLQLQDAATRTPSLPFRLMNSESEKNKKNDANIIICSYGFFSGNPGLLPSTHCCYHDQSCELPGHLTRLVPKARETAENVDRSFTSATSRIFAATKKCTENIARSFQLGSHTTRRAKRPHMGPKQTLETAKKKWCIWLNCFSASGSLVADRWCCWLKSSYQIHSEQDHVALEHNNHSEIHSGAARHRNVAEAIPWPAARNLFSDRNPWDLPGVILLQACSNLESEMPCGDTNSKKSSSQKHQKPEQGETKLSEKCAEYIRIRWMATELEQ